MKISELIQTLQHIQATQGDLPVQLQSDPSAKPGVITCYESIFVVPEEYEGEGRVVSVRPWPY